MKRKKIYLIVQNEPFFIPKIILFLSKYKKYIEIIGITILKPSRKNKTMIDWLKERLIIYRLSELVIVTFCLAYVFIANRLGNKVERAQFSSRNLSKLLGINIKDTSSINSEEYIDFLKLKKPDIVVSISCPEIFGNKIISIPKLVCINAHGTLLPKHRGVHGSWWTLFNKDKWAGSTIHLIESKLDSGDILASDKVKLGYGETQFSVAYKTKYIISRLLIKVFLNLMLDKQNNTTMDLTKGNYNYAPNQHEVQNFRDKKLKVITFQNFFDVIRRTF